MKYTFSLALTILVSVVLYSQKTLIHCGKLLDTKNGKVLSEQTITVANDLILSVDPGYASAKANERIINLKAYTVMPGFIDMHVHIEGETNPKRYLETFTKNEADIAFTSAEIANRTLMAGFTTVRDLGGTGVNVALRNAITAGTVPGPRIFTAEKAIGTTGGHADPTNGFKRSLKGNPGPNEGVINSVSDARKAVRQRYKNGADLIKITATGGVLSVSKNGANPQFRQEEVDEIVRTAKEYGMAVAAHAHGKEGMQRAIKAGVQTIEHGSFMDQETARLMITHGTHLVPTLSAGKYVADKAKIKGYYPDIIIPKIEKVDATLKKTFTMLAKSDVKIAFGTDAGVFPHGENAKEFRYMVDYGWSPMFAIQSATITNATLLGMKDNLGVLAPNHYADIIATEKDPTVDITTTESIVFVMKNGVIYKNDISEE